jgi:CRP-like cAMP-binding protein
MWQTFSEGDMIIKQGTEGDCLYVIQEGTVEVIAETGDKEVKLTELGPGEFFGEMGLFDKDVRSCTVRAVGKSKILTIDKRNFYQTIQKDPALAFRLLETMSRRIRQTNQKVTDLQKKYSFDTDLYAGILSEANVLVRKKFMDLWDSRFAYHDLAHTREVFNGTQLIGKTIGLDEEERFLAGLAALFHDIGHLSGTRNHEERGVIELGNFLSAYKLDPDKVEAVEDAILATRVPQKPTSRIAEVLCDADLMYLASDHFLEKAEHLRLEWWDTGKRKADPMEFLRFSLDFLQEHHYHTPFGRGELTRAKEANMELLKRKIMESGPS